MKDITFGVTWYLREQDLERCVNRVRKYYPKSKIDTQNTGGNLSWGRNQLVGRCSTPYYFMLEEDMRIHPPDVVKISEMRSILVDRRILGVNPLLVEGSRTVSRCRIFRKRRKGVEIALARIIKKLNGVDAVVSNLTQNVGLFSTERLSGYRWNERLEMAEHHLFFWDVFKCGRHVMATIDGRVRHVYSRPTTEYRSARRRGNRGELFDLSNRLVGVGGGFFSNLKLKDDYHEVLKRIPHGRRAARMSRRGY